MVTEIGLPEFLLSFSPVYPEGGTWEDTVHLLTTDPVENLTITHLVNILHSEGSFREPITVSENEDDEGNLLGSWRVSDGTHRVVASILAAVKTIHITKERSYPEDDKYEAITAILRFEDEQEYDTTKHEGLFDYFSDRLRSFPIDNEVWANSDIIFGTKGGLEFTYTGVPLTEKYFASIESIIMNLWELSPFKNYTPQIVVEPWVDDYPEDN